jgi:hypothetical protein
LRDPNVEVYRDGSVCFAGMLNSSDLLEGTPVEVAYAWALSCAAAVDGEIVFLRARFRFEGCTELLAARIFTGGNISDGYDLSAVKCGVMYYAKEGVEDLPMHPLGDIFFRTKDGKLVLVDITGGSDNLCTKKGEAIADWIKAVQPELADLTLHGVVLAPSAEGESSSAGSVEVVRGEAARAHLRGLRQIFRWM